MDFRRQERRKSREHPGLKIGVEDVFAPMVSNNVLGLVDLPDRLERSAEGHRALWSVWVASVKPVDDGLGPQARRFNGLLGARLSSRRSWPAREVLPCGVERPEIHAGCGIVDQRPLNRVSLSGVGKTRQSGGNSRRIAGLGGMHQFTKGGKARAAG